MMEVVGNNRTLCCLQEHYFGSGYTIFANPDNG